MEPIRHNAPDATAEAAVEALRLTGSEDGSWRLADPRDSSGESLSRWDLESTAKFFEGATLVAPDPVRRPAGDTTLFTAAGVQRIETILRTGGGLARETFAVPQPVVRSQFMDRVAPGTLSTFLNFSVVAVRGGFDDFSRLTSQFVELVTAAGVDPQDLRFSFGTDSAKWGSRRFTNSSITVFARGVELGECVLIHDFPTTKDGEKITIVDLGFGVERVAWACGGAGESTFGALPDLGKVVVGIPEPTASGLVDPIRGMALLGSEGVVGGRKEHEYRFRQLSKRYVAREAAAGRGIDERAAAEASLRFWSEWGHRSAVDSGLVADSIQRENDRNRNAATLAAALGRKDAQDVDVNLPRAEFLASVRKIVPDLMRQTDER